MSEQSRTARIVKHSKSINNVEKIHIELASGQVFELEDLTGRKVVNVVRELGGELLDLAKEINPENMSPAEMTEKVIELLDDDQLDKLVGVLFDGYPVLDLRIRDLFELVEKYVEAVDLDSVFQVYTRLKLMVRGHKVIEEVRHQMEKARQEEHPASK